MKIVTRGRENLSAEVLVNNAAFRIAHEKFWNEKHAHREGLHDDGNQPVMRMLGMRTTGGDGGDAGKTLSSTMILLHWRVYKSFDLLYEIDQSIGSPYSIKKLRENIIM